MKKFALPFAAAILVFAGLYSCSKTNEDQASSALSQEVRDAIYNLNFNPDDAYAYEDGYIVEGDIFLTKENLAEGLANHQCNTPDAEQYRTTNLVNAGGGRNITISVSDRLSQAYVDATNEAIARYNARNLLLTFSNVGTTGGEIHIVKGNGPYLASAGFPSGGNPYGEVKVNPTQMNGQPLATKASIIAHELGHCIGFRHTDYFNRSLSCGTGGNEGAGDVGAIHIAGTPTGFDANSWMLACICSGCNRPFNNNDQSALNTLY
jgi:hypothetical protein